MNKEEYGKKIKIEIVELQKIQKILQIKTPSHSFLDGIIGITIASMTDLLAYLDGKNQYYSEFNEVFFTNRQIGLHKFFLLELHIATEEGLLEIIRENNFPVPKTKKEKALEIIDEMEEQNKQPIQNKLHKLIKLVPRNLTFNDYLNCVLNNIKLSEEYKEESRKYCDAFNVVRNKVSHSDTQLTPHEKETLIRGKFSAAIVNEVGLQMTFQWYKILFLDIIRFFDNLYARL
jgi:hypothetical protein